MIKITQVKVKRFRSIHDLTLNLDQTYNISTICGQNNVGKTNVLRSLNLFFGKRYLDFKKDVPEFKQMTLGASVYPIITLSFRDEKNSDSFEITKDYNPKFVSEDTDEQYVISGKKNNIAIDQKECLKFLDNLNIFYLPSINISFPETIKYLVDDKFLDIEFGESRMSGKKRAGQRFIGKC